MSEKNAQNAKIGFLWMLILLIQSCPTPLTPEKTQTAPIAKTAVGKPAFDPPGGIFSSDQLVCISCSTAEAAIYYTTDGSAPTAASNQYSSPLPVTGDGTSVTIRAIAIKPGMSNSEIAEATYTIDYSYLSPPRFNPAPGVYNDDLQVILSSDDGAFIRYTVDGSTPTPLYGIEYHGSPIDIAKTAPKTIRAVAYKTGMKTSSVAIGGYTFDMTAPTGSIVNLHDFGTLETSLLRGTALDDDAVATVEVSIDAGPYYAASGTEAWSYSIPLGACTPGIQPHTLSVRIRDRAGNSSYLTKAFSKGVSRDFNGDGFADLAVASPNEGSYGCVRVFNGKSGGPDADPSQEFSALFYPEFSTHAKACGDFNGDGYADLVLFSLGLFKKAGILYGSASGLVDGLESLGSGYNDAYGYGIAVGDLNGDGCDDIAVSRMYKNENTGEVVIRYGSTSGLGTPTTLAGESAGDYFGYALAVGDLNGDGYADLAVGATQTSPNKGKVYVYSGGSTGIGGVTKTLLPSSDNSYRGFGTSLAMADLNGDGYSDLIIGERRYIGTYSHLYWYPGGASGIGLNATSVTNLNYDSPGPISAGNVDGDLFQDIVVYFYVSSPGSPRGELFHGGLTGLASASIRSYPGDVFDFGDVNGDAYSDLTVGTAPTAGVFFGSAGGLAPPSTPDLTLTGTDASFGSSLIN